MLSERYRSMTITFVDRRNFPGNTFYIEYIGISTEVFVSSRSSADTADSEKPCDFTAFEIDDALRSRLQSIGSFGCDAIWYGSVPSTLTTGHIDRRRWLFGVLGLDWVFQVFETGDEGTISWDNYKNLSLERSWEIVEEAQTKSSKFLTHDAVFLCILKGVEEFRSQRPFG
ncbi:hypothetical protein IFT66_08710 [Rhizobium sp. CFBP 13726]|uniref:hypothetical protein n=1 Tax=Rhizobium sp. CFBP 13726 TaxID=2775296 RepID=UPI001786E2C8|nr:hypothetical protein [Rhizobium sp. CFBP 13726]MBD8651153.1 hypothetical protein [Rhizobium sp. CFBP 13726]